MTVALDTNTLIWGLQSADSRGGNPRQKNLKEMQQRSRILLSILEEGGETIIVPTVMVAELLIKVEVASHSRFLATLQGRFFIPPFDLRACALAADLWIRHRGLARDEQIQRTTLKADVLIVATAKVAGAKLIYSNDPKFRKLAESAPIKAEDLPVKHPDMFRDRELRGDPNQ
jgi:predicted nucleic acid-binding protein